MLVVSKSSADRVFKSQMKDKICTITIDEVISNKNAMETEQLIYELIDEYQPEAIHLQLNGSDISSMGLGCIIELYQSMLKVNKKVVLSLSESLQQKFDRTQVNKVLDIFPTETQARQYLITYLNSGNLN